MIALDASVLLAYLFKESGHEIVAQLVTADQVWQQTNFALQILVIR